MKNVRLRGSSETTISWYRGRKYSADEDFEKLGCRFLIHPLTVHFPIALLLTGALCDTAGILLRRDLFLNIFLVLRHIDDGRIRHDGISEDGIWFALRSIGEGRSAGLVTEKDADEDRNCNDQTDGYE